MGRLTTAILLFAPCGALVAAKKRGVSPGGDIMLHDLPKEYACVGKAHTLHDWTDGCIAVTNEEMDEI